jgi:hypothetical protein
MQRYFKVSSSVLSGKIAKYIAVARKDMDRFFGFSISDPLVFFLGKRADMDMIGNRKTEKWVSAMTRGGAIFIFNPKLFDKVTNHKKEDFWKTIKHEFVHLYFGKATKGFKPKWLNEGLASHLAGQKSWWSATIKAKAMSVFDYYETGGNNVYPVGQFWTELLLKKFGKRKMVKLITALDKVATERQFAVVFRRVYGFNYSKSNFFKLLK